MARTNVRKGRKKTSRKPQIIKAVCSFPDGDSRRLFVMSLSLGGAFILSLKPPPFGAVFSMTLFPGPTPLPPIEARVIGLRIDPTNIDRCGFEVVFTHLSDAVLSQLSSLIQQLELNAIHPNRERLSPLPDRRENPRISTRLEALIDLPDTCHQAKVDDLSIAGALLRLETKETRFSSGDELQVSIVAPTTPERLSLKARVVRIIEGSDPQELGVLFIDINDVMQRRLEGLILDALTEAYELPI